MAKEVGLLQKTLALIGSGGIPDSKVIASLAKSKIDWKALTDKGGQNIDRLLQLVNQQHDITIPTALVTTLTLTGKDKTGEGAQRFGRSTSSFFDPTIDLQDLNNY